MNEADFKAPVTISDTWIVFVKLVCSVFIFPLVLQVLLILFTVLQEFA